MNITRGINFLFDNQIAPRYVSSILVHLQPDAEYDSAALLTILHKHDPSLVGRNIVSLNARWWLLAGLVKSRASRVGHGQKRFIGLSKLGQEVVSAFGTNRDQAFETLHFLLYSTWPRSLDLARAKFWTYQTACDLLWQHAPTAIDTAAITNQLQAKCKLDFPSHNPSFSDRAVRGIYVWLESLSPPFLEKPGKGGRPHTQRRNHCTPQLFFLATDLLYSLERVTYGTSLAIGDHQIEAICKTCLLDPGRFWDMADLTRSTIRGFDIRRGQWSTAIVLNGPPNWITLPDFSRSVPAQGGDDPSIEEAA